MIRKFEKEDFHLLEKWITDADLMFQFSGQTWEFPLTREAFDAYNSSHNNRYFYIGYEVENKPFAFGEIITDGSNYSPRLGRLLIGDAQLRGKGLGQNFISELIDECIKLTSTKEIFLFVFEHNFPAIKCYEKLGFFFTNDSEFILNYKGKEFKVLKMRLEV